MSIGTAKSPARPQAKREPTSTGATSFPTEDRSPPSWRTALTKLFGIDPRTLAVFRMAVATIILADLTVRATDLKAMYTDEGMFSRLDILRGYPSFWNWSFHFASGSAGYQAMLFAIAGAMALALLVGLETWLVTFGSWLMLVSVDHRVPPVVSGADILLRMLLFWGMFLPLGEAWSIDAWLCKRRGGSQWRQAKQPILSVASGAILVQMALMYLLSATFKFNADWLGGTAIATSLAHDFFASPVGMQLLAFPRLLTVLTWATLAVEWLAPIVVFSPWGTAKFRIAAVFALAGLHAGVIILMDTGIFPFVCLAGIALFLPAEFWDKCWRWSRFCKAGGEEVAAPPLSSKESEKPAWSFAIQIGCALFLLYVIALNFNGLPNHPLAWLAPENWKPLTIGCGLGQRWGMFEVAPSNTGWYVAKAKLNDGSEVDLLQHGGPVDWHRPQFPLGMYPNSRWRKLFREMSYYDEQGFQKFRAPVARYLCRTWNQRHPLEKQVAEFEFIFCSDSAQEARTGPIPAALRQRLVYLDLSQSRH